MFVVCVVFVCMWYVLCSSVCCVCVYVVCIVFECVLCLCVCGMYCVRVCVVFVCMWYVLCSSVCCVCVLVQVCLAAVVLFWVGLNEGWGGVWLGLMRDGEGFWVELIREGFGWGLMRVGGEWWSWFPTSHYHCHIQHVGYCPLAVPHWSEEVVKCTQLCTVVHQSTTPSAPP